MYCCTCWSAGVNGCPLLLIDIVRHELLVFANIFSPCLHQIYSRTHAFLSLNCTQIRDLKAGLFSFPLCCGTNALDPYYLAVLRALEKKKQKPELMHRTRFGAREKTSVVRIDSVYSYYGTSYLSLVQTKFLRRDSSMPGSAPPRLVPTATRKS